MIEWGNWRYELLNNSGQIDLRYGAYRRYLSLSDWKIGLLNNTYLRHKNKFIRDFFNYRTSNKPYDMVVDFYTSPISHIVYLDNGSLSVCLGFLYYYKHITGAELVNVAVSGHTIKLDMNSVYTCCRSELFYKVINGEILNLHMDRQLRLMYGTPYLSSIAYTSGLFRPLKMHLNFELEQVSNPSLEDYTMDSKDIIHYEQRKKELLRLDLSYYLNCSDFDISSLGVSWRYDVISIKFAERVRQVRGY